MTLVELKARRALYTEAINKVLKNQSYTIAETTYTYADLKTLQEGVKMLDKRIARVERGGMSVKRFIPVDD